MSSTTTIEWTDATWNPVTGCTKISAGCDRCYAETFAERFRDTPGHYFENGFDVQLREDKLGLPFRWRKPRKVFVNSMSDLFHDNVPDDYILRVFAVMALNPQHTFQVLTKRHGRLRSLLNSVTPTRMLAEVHREKWMHDVDARVFTWPLPNVWLGVSVENQQWADIRIPALLDTPAAVRWISAEPLLGPIDLHGSVDPVLGGRRCLTYWLTGRPSWGEPRPSGPAGTLMSDLKIGPKLDWVVVGGESGRGARPMHPNWARAIRDQCADSGVPFLFKQWGEWASIKAGGHTSFDYVTNEDACQVVDVSGTLRGRPWRGWAVQDGTRDGDVMRRYGKAKAGRVLDGRTHDEYPAVAADAEEVPGG